MPPPPLPKKSSVTPLPVHHPPSPTHPHSNDQSKEKDSASSTQSPHTNNDKEFRCLTEGEKNETVHRIVCMFEYAKKHAEEIAKEQIKSIESFIINEMIKKLEEKS